MQTGKDIVSTKFSSLSWADGQALDTRISPSIVVDRVKEPADVIQPSFVETTVEKPTSLDVEVKSCSFSTCFKRSGFRLHKPQLLQQPTTDESSPAKDSTFLQLTHYPADTSSLLGKRYQPSLQIIKGDIWSLYSSSPQEVSQEEQALIDENPSISVVKDANINEDWSVLNHPLVQKTKRKSSTSTKTTQPQTTVLQTLKLLYDSLQLSKALDRVIMRKYEKVVRRETRITNLIKRQRDHPIEN